MDSSEQLVRRFCDIWANADLDEIVSYFTPDAVYHNIPVDPVQGPDQIRATLEGFMAGIEKIEFRVHHLVAQGDVVLTERTDAFFLPGGQTVDLPVMGIFEVAGDKIAKWRDYFDLNQFMTQLAEKSG